MVAKYKILIAVLLLLATAFAATSLLFIKVQAPYEKIKDFNYFIAANFYNSEDALKYSLPELQKALKFVDRGDNIFISFVENGSKDKTVELLKDFQSSITYPSSLLFCNTSSASAWSVAKILGEGYIKKIFKQNPLIRYQKMAALRNSALEPLKPGLFKNSLETKVLFLNDIFFTASDVLSLIHTNQGEYDIVCGLDYYYQFYDVLVTRDIKGYWFSGFYPHTRHPESQKALRNNLPFRVKACWNGMVSMNAKGFLDKGIRFRGREYNGNKKCECVQSECLLVCLDFYREGLVDIFINPAVKVSYEWNYFIMHTLPGFRELVWLYQSFFYELEEEIEINEGDDYFKEIYVDNTIGCSMPPYWEPTVPRVYMEIDQKECKINLTESEVYNRITVWQMFEKNYYTRFYNYFMSKC